MKSMITDPAQSPPIPGNKNWMKNRRNEGFPHTSTAYGIYILLLEYMNIIFFMDQKFSKIYPPLTPQKTGCLLLFWI